MISVAVLLLTLPFVHRASEEQGANSDFKAYGTGKIYNQLFVRELQRRLEGTGVDVYTCQPGMSQTRLFEKGAHWKWSVVLQARPC